MPYGFETALSPQSDFTVAIATVHRPVDTKFKGYFNILAALCEWLRQASGVESCSSCLRNVLTSLPDGTRGSAWAR